VKQPFLNAASRWNFRQAIQEGNAVAAGEMGSGKWVQIIAIGNGELSYAARQSHFHP
jgi:hypothetical protein